MVLRKSHGWTVMYRRQVTQTLDELVSGGDCGWKYLLKKKRWGGGTANLSLRVSREEKVTR